VTVFLCIGNIKMWKIHSRFWKFLYPHPQDFRDPRHNTGSYRRASFDSTDSYQHHHHHHHHHQQQHRKASNSDSVPGKPEDVNGIDWEDGLKRWGNR